MKKITSIFLLLIMIFTMMISCNEESDNLGTDTSTNTDTSTDTDDNKISDEDLSNLNIASTEIDYYQTIYLGEYLGEDAGISAKENYPNAYARKITTYKEAVKLVSNFSLLDEAIFEEYDILVIERTGTFYFNEIGYRNLDDSYIAKYSIALDVVNAGANEAIETVYDYILVPKEKDVTQDEDANLFKPIQIITSYKDGYTFITKEVDRLTFDPQKEKAWYFEDAIDAMKFIYSQSTEVEEAVPDLEYDSSSAVVFYHTKVLKAYKNRTSSGFFGFFDVFANSNNIYLSADYYYHKDGISLKEGMYLSCVMLPKELLPNDISQNPQIHVFLNQYNGSTYTSSEEIADEDILEEIIEFKYVYHHRTDPTTKDYLATLLCGGSYLRDGFENVEIPKDIIAGDKIHIRYIGEMYTELSEPGKTYLHNGKIISYGFSFAEVLHVSKVENILSEVKSEYDLLSDYVILDTDGRYTKLDSYNGNELYLVVKQDDDSTPTTEVLSATDSSKKQITCMYAYNPRTKASENQRAYEADFLYYVKQVDYQTPTITSRLFFENSLLEGEFEKIVFPSNIIAGDILHFEYSGTITSAQTAPANTVLIGELKSYHFTYADVIKIEKSNFDIEELQEKYLLPEYVVLNKEGKCMTLEKFVQSSDFKTIYLTVKQATNVDFIKEKTSIVAIYAYNPRTNAEPNEAVFEADFIYNHVFDSETNEPLATLLFDASYLHIDGIDFPSNLVAGDKLYIEYDGVMMTEESYPGHTYLYGELISYRFELAEVICLENYHLDILTEEGFALPSDENIILSKEGSFMSLKEYVEAFPNAVLYVSVIKAPSFNYWGDETHIMAIYAYNPREIN